MEYWTYLSEVTTPQTGRRRRNGDGRLLPRAARVAGAEKICRGWYVKLTLLPEHILLVSFHPLEQPIRTARGKKVMP